MTFREFVAAIEEAGDLVGISNPVHWDREAAAVAAESLAGNGPALRFENSPGMGTLVSGIAAGPDQLARPRARPIPRISRAFGAQDFVELLELVGVEHDDQSPPIEEIDTEERPVDLYDMGLPSQLEPGGRPRIDLAVCCAGTMDDPIWVPTHGNVRDGSSLSLVVPRAITRESGGMTRGESVAVALGVSPMVNVATMMRWVHRLGNGSSAGRAAAMGDVGMREERGLPIPAGAEITIHGTLTGEMDSLNAVPARWELATDVTRIDIDVERVVVRPDPLIPFVPRSKKGPVPMADDAFLTSVSTAANLYRRLNAYWGVKPVHWVHLPVEAGLGVCFASVDVLYAGFQWQLANTLFSFSPLFDKVVLLDEDNAPSDLAGALDDMWVRAHPAQDWHFSESESPRAIAPAYYRPNETGARVYIDATWDPNWDEEYIAPRVTFGNSYPDEVAQRASDLWDATTGKDH